MIIYMIILFPPILWYNQSSDFISSLHLVVFVLFFHIGTITNLGSLEIHASTYISAKLKKRTYMYDSLQFPVEMNTRDSKPLTTFIPFHTKCDLQEQFWLFSQSYLQNGMLWLLNNFNILHDLKTDTFERCRHIYSFICMSLLTR